MTNKKNFKINIFFEENKKIFQILTTILTVISILIISVFAYRYVFKFTNDIDRIEDSQILESYLKKEKSALIKTYSICQNNQRIDLFHNETNNQIISLILDKNNQDLTHCDYYTINAFLTDHNIVDKIN
jgi:hypothetical protein